jgi:hypothetical protein
MARQFGRGGVQRVFEITSLSRVTVRRGFGRAPTLKRQRKVVSVVPAEDASEWKKTPRVTKLLNELLKDSTAGDPMGGLSVDGSIPEHLACRSSAIVQAAMPHVPGLGEWPCNAWRMSSA